MKTEKCREMMNLFLKGERSEEVVKHLQDCPECRELAALCRAVSGMKEPMKVPEELDRAVLAYASAKRRPAPKAWDFAFILRHAVIPAAAAAVVCAGLVFAFHQPVEPNRKTMAQVQNQAQYDLDMVDSEVLMLSSRIQTAAAQLNRTEVFSGINE